jgi:integrase/recombinase XerD
MHANLRAVKRLFHWCLAEGHITCDPTVRLRLTPLAKEPPKAVSDDDLVRLLDAAAGSGPRDLALVAFIADTACRCAGAAGARLSELDIDQRCAVVREKGQKQRAVFFGSETALALLQWLDVRPPDPSDALFVNWRDGGFLSPTGVYQVFKRLARAAGLIDDGRRYNPHGLRHAWARRALQAGMDLGTVSEIMGHTGIEVTARFYARWADRELQERKEAYSRPLQVPATGTQPGANRVTIGRQPGEQRGA